MSTFFFENWSKSKRRLRSHSDRSWFCCMRAVCISHCHVLLLCLLQSLSFLLYQLLHGAYIVDHGLLLSWGFFGMRRNIARASFLLRNKTRMLSAGKNDLLVVDATALLDIWILIGRGYSHHFRWKFYSRIHWIRSIFWFCTLKI